MRTLLKALLIGLALCGVSHAQSAPNWYNGKIPTAAEVAAAFASKQDVFNYTAVNKAGDIMLGPFGTAPSSTNSAGFNVPIGVDPTSPKEGDVWATTQGFFVHINGATRRISLTTGYLLFTASVNFNLIADTQIPISLPPGFTRYIIQAVRISGATANLTTSQVGLFTNPGGAGTVLVPAGTAVTVSTTTDGAANNAQSVTFNNSGIASYTLAGNPILYWRVTQSAGLAATGSVEIIVVPVP